MGFLPEIGKNTEAGRQQGAMSGTEGKFTTFLRGRCSVHPIGEMGIIMSGIAGIYNLDGQPVDRKLLKRMTDVIAHRGADGEGRWANGSVGLGHRQLCTTEESYKGKQPLSNRSGTCWITCDGRVDNREELCTELADQGLPLEVPTDAELILQTYEIWGTECLKKLIGVFAFAIWDETKQRLFCARDPLGRRPFFYHCDQKMFIWGSEIRQLLLHSNIDRRISEDYIADFLVMRPLGPLAEERTPYQGIVRLLPGHFLIVGQEGMKKEQYWHINQLRPIRYADHQEYVEHFRDLFYEAVRCRLRSRTPVGVMLSGGRDSTSVACMASKIYRELGFPNGPIMTFSEVFDELHECDERRYIKDTVRKWDLRAHYIKGDNLWPWKDELSPALPADEPGRPLSQAGIKTLCNRVHEVGIKVLLTGVGGDHVLRVDRLYFITLLHKFQMKKILSLLRDYKSVTGAKPMRIVGFLANKYVPFIARQWFKHLMLFSSMSDTQGRTENLTFSCINRSFAAKTSLRERSRQIPVWRRSSDPVVQKEYNGIILETSCLFIDQYFSLPLSIEERHPFFDLRLVQFLLMIPSEEKHQPGRSKTILLETLRDILPESVIARKRKTYFNSLAFKGIEKEWYRVQQLLHNPYVSTLGFVDREKVAKLAESYKQGKLEAGPPLENIMALELWLRSLSSCNAPMSLSVGSLETKLGKETSG